MPEAVIVAAVRTPVGKAPNGMLRHTRPDDLAAAAITAALAAVPAVDPAEVEDVILGCAMPEGEQGLNVARIASLRAGVPHTASAVTVNRFCASGLQSIAYAAERIQAGAVEVVIAGGTESMSLVPMGGLKVSPNPTLVDTYPDVYLSNGLVAENHARTSKISREAQDAFAFESHRKAIAAIDAGRFAREIVAVDAAVVDDAPAFGRAPAAPRRVAVDEGPRRDTSIEKLARLKPVFDPDGTTTAGNAPGVNDGAAALVVTSDEFAKRRGLEVLATILAQGYVADEFAYLARTPAKAGAIALEKAGKTIDDVERVELNEAFSSVVLNSTKLLGADPEKVNVNGGAVALGHPIGASGARILGTMVQELRRNGGGLGLAAICSGGGQGDAILLEV
jgi:acetyl-CoA acyltransferase